MGEFQYFTLSSAFATKLEAGFHSISMGYKALGSTIPVCPDEKPTHGLNLQLMTLHHELKFYKFI